MTESKFEEIKELLSDLTDEELEGILEEINLILEANREMKQ